MNSSLKNVVATIEKVFYCCDLGSVASYSIVILLFALGGDLREQAASKHDYA